MKRSPLFLLSILGLAGALIAFAPLPVQPSTPQQRTIRLEASQFEYSPAEIDVNPGDTLTIQLVSTDVVHGLYVDDYGVALTADPGQTASLTFVADKAGSFRFRCNVTCGAMHPFMIGKLNVGMNTALWRALGVTALMLFAALLLSPQPIRTGGA